MAEKNKKIEMHLHIATKMVSEIKRRSIDKLSEFEEELMTSGKVSSSNKNDLMAYMKTETTKQDEYFDKLRLVLIYILCSNDSNEVKSMIDILRQLHADKFNEAFIQSVLKKRSDFEALLG